MRRIIYPFFGVWEIAGGSWKGVGLFCTGMHIYLGICWLFGDRDGLL